ncbi:MAG TPA: hypothetical protein VMI10_21460 [Terriglobales bacterium]|nr:hypothetical protein [Terriglobales bacterium]
MDISVGLVQLLGILLKFIYDLVVLAIQTFYRKKPSHPSGKPPNKPRHRKRSDDLECPRLEGWLPPPPPYFGLVFACESERE